MILELVVEVKFTVRRTAIGTGIRTQVSKKKREKEAREKIEVTKEDRV